MRVYVPLLEYTQIFGTIYSPYIVLLLLVYFLMAIIYRKPKHWRSYAIGGLVIGDPPLSDDRIIRHRNTAQKNARRLRRELTPAEKKLKDILNHVNGGALRGRFFCQWAFADKWILDFFFYENRLAIEVDGSIHSTIQQKEVDRQKEDACKKWDITLIRVTNQEIFGNRTHLLARLGEGWSEAKRNIKSSVFAPQ